MIKENLFSFEFIKKSPFYGSFRGMRYRIGRKDEELEVCIYPDEADFEHTPEEKKVFRIFAFSPEGYGQAADYLEEAWKSAHNGN